MVFPKILNEKLGVSSNTSRTVDYIKRILTDCMIYISRFTVTDRPFNKVLPHSVQLHKSLELMNSFTTTADNDSIVCHWQFQFPKTSAAVWMSDDSILDIYCRIYESEEAMKNSMHRSKIFSVSKPAENNKVFACMNFTMHTAYNTDVFICGGYKFSIIDADKTIPVIQHELNHLNKRRETYIHTAEYKEQYDNLMGLLQATNTTNPAVAAIAIIIYRYCVKTEAEAYTEQFYKEWIRIFKDNNPLFFYKLDKERGRNLPTEKYTEYAKQTSTYKTFAMIYDWLIENKDTLISSYADILYDKFCNIAEYFLKIRPGKYSTDKTTWCKEFIRKIEQCMDNFLKRCARTTCIVESENWPVAMKLEEILP